MRAYIAEFVMLNKGLKHPEVELPPLIKFINSNFIPVHFHTKYFFSFCTKLLPLPRDSVSNMNLGDIPVGQLKILGESGKQIIKYKYLHA